MQQVSSILFRSVYATSISKQQPVNKLFAKFDFYEYERSSTLCLPAHFFYNCTGLLLSLKLPWPTQTRLRNAQSDSSVIIDQTLNSFAVATKENVITLSTLNETLPIMCRKADGFQIQGHGCFKNISLPTLYSRPDFPNDRSHIPSANICNQFDHLRPIAGKLLPLQNVEIGLLLGYDVSYVHQPQEIVSSKIESDPYAVRTLLGWCVIGSIGQTWSINRTISNRISCSERTSIIYKTEAKEVYQ